MKRRKPSTTAHYRIFSGLAERGEIQKSAAVFRLHAQVKQAGQYAVYFSNIEKVYGIILSELFTSDAILNPEALESNRKSHFAKTLKIRSNRAKIKKLSKAELLVLYRENMILTESERVEWGTLYEYAAFLHKRGYHAKTAEVGERLDAHYTAGDKPDERAPTNAPRSNACSRTAICRRDNMRRRSRTTATR